MLGCTKSMQIRLAVRSDYDQLLDLLRQLNPTDPEASEIELKVFEEIIESKHFDLVVADDEDIILGTCYINIIPNITRGGRPYAVIENVVTDSAHRRYGIGAKVQDIDDPSLRVKRVTTSMTQY